MPNVHFLENNVAEIGGVVFLGCCLWTDFSLPGPAHRSFNMIMAELGMDDYTEIQGRGRRPIKPEDTFSLHRQSVKWLRKSLDTYQGRRVVVVTHHAPSELSIPVLHRGSRLNPAFASNLEWMIDKFQPAIWVHGHTHGVSDY